MAMIETNAEKFVQAMREFAAGDDGRPAVNEPNADEIQAILDRPIAHIALVPPVVNIEGAPANESGVFFLMKRVGPEWDLASEVMGISDNRLECEGQAEAFKKRFPAFSFGTAKLVSVAAEVEKPIETRRLDS